MSEIIKIGDVVQLRSGGLRILENPAGRSDLIRPLYETELRAQ